MVRFLRRGILPLACLSVAAVGCGVGVVGMPADRADPPILIHDQGTPGGPVTPASYSYKLIADEALILSTETCFGVTDMDGCRRYPNPIGCHTLALTIDPSGEIAYECNAADGSTLASGTARGTEGILVGLPFVCRSARLADNTPCLHCADVFDNAVIDTCGELPHPSGEVQRMIADVWGRGTAHGPADPCSPRETLRQLAERFNEIMVEEKLDLRWDPLASWAEPKMNELLQNSSRWGASSMDYVEWCKKRVAGDVGKAGRAFAVMASCVPEAEKVGCCYCRSNEMCRCHRFAYAAYGRLCPALVQTAQRCENVSEHEMMTAVAMSALGQYFAPGGDLGRASGTWELANKGQPADVWTRATEYGMSGFDIKTLSCQGSPLVLDLAGDGIALTSLEDGVHFDLFGMGATPTAWITGENALLVFDRNGNGIIDDGQELFGEGTLIGNWPAPDGFSALAQLDTPAYGGNGDGRIDAQDLFFSELRLWQDRNRDGISQPDELLTLADAGIVAIDVAMIRDTGEQDAFGNGIGMQGRFFRTDGSTGLMVDVLFRYGEHAAVPGAGALTPHR